LHQVGDLFELNVKLRCQNVKQDLQCTRNVIWSRVRVTTLSVEKQEVLHITSVCF